jgi:hypothetical protein
MSNYEDFVINQGADIALEIHCLNDSGSVKNLAGHSVSASMKRNLSDSANSPDTVQFNGFVADAEGGILTLSLNNQQTDVLKPRGNYFYDVELSFTDSSSGDTIIERILEGQIEVSPSVTK